MKKRGSELKVKFNGNNKTSVLDLKTVRKCSCVETKRGKKKPRHFCNQHYSHYFLCSSKPTCLLPYWTSHLSWTQQRVNEIQKVLHGASDTTANVTKDKERRRQMNRKCAWMLSGRKQQAGLGRADDSTGCLQAGTAARWQWSSPPRRTGCTRKWAARQGLSSSTDASSRVATRDSLEDMASCIPSRPAPEPPCSPCLHKTCTEMINMCRRVCLAYSWLQNYCHPWRRGGKGYLKNKQKTKNPALVVNELNLIFNWST